MSIQTALQIIEDYQIWRRGGTHPMPNPSYIGQAFDTLLAYVKALEDAETIDELVQAHPSVNCSYEGIWVKTNEAPKWVIDHFTQESC